MTKKSFIALANTIKRANTACNRDERPVFNQDSIEYLADFCAAQNPQFNRSRWFSYIAGTCGTNGGSVKLPFAIGDDVLASPVGFVPSGFSARVIALKKDTDGTQLYTVKDQDDNAFDCEASELIKAD